MEIDRLCGKNRKKSEMKKVPKIGTFLVVAGEIFIKYADEFFPFLFGREGSFDQKGAYLSIV